MNLNTIWARRRGAQINISKALKSFEKFTRAINFVFRFNTDTKTKNYIKLKNSFNFLLFYLHLGCNF